MATIDEIRIVQLYRATRAQPRRYTVYIGKRNCGHTHRNVKSAGGCAARIMREALKR